MKTRIKEPIANYQLTVGELVSELLMTINVCNEKVLVVEGSTDKRFWEMLQKRFNMKMDIRVANKKECDSNKEYVIKVIKKVNQKVNSNNLIFGVVDYDYDWILKSLIVEKGLFYYKYHDLEVNLILSWGFRMVNQMISSESKQIETDILRNYLFEWTYDIGIFRLLNRNQGLGYKFTSIDWKRLAPLYISELKSEALEVVMNKLQIPIGGRSKILEQMMSLKNLKYPKEYICSGHDMVRLLSALTVNFISTQRANKYDDDYLTELLTLAYNIEPVKLSQNSMEHGLLDIICDYSMEMEDGLSIT